jgi:hypothetical protein
MFDDLDDISAPIEKKLKDEIKAYLNADLETHDNVLEWWRGRRKTYPRLSRMALDYLTIPGTLSMALRFSFLKFSQLFLLTLNVYSAKATSFCCMCAVGCPFKAHALFYALVPGVWPVM